MAKPQRQVCWGCLSLTANPEPWACSQAEPSLGRLCAQLYDDERQKHENGCSAVVYPMPLLHPSQAGFRRQRTLGCSRCHVTRGRGTARSQPPPEASAARASQPGQERATADRPGVDAHVALTRSPTNPESHGAGGLHWGPSLPGHTELPSPHCKQPVIPTNKPNRDKAGGSWTEKRKYMLK